MDSQSSLVLSYEDAQRTVRRHAQPLLPHSATESVPLLASLGRILARPAIADRDQPPFPRSTRDGFACRVQDLPGPLRVIGQLRAGQRWTGPPLQHGDALEIMTGAPVPAAADCVVMVEHVAAESGTIRLSAARTLQPGENIVPTGAEAKAGTVVVAAGTRMTPAAIAAAAACGYAHLECWPRVRVAILSTGDELVPVAERPLDFQIRNSNSYSLAAQVQAMGAEPVILPVAPDRLDATEAAIRIATECDLVVLTGGVSMGRYDVVEEALRNLGAEFFFTGARIQPGRPVVFGRLPHHKYFFGLPGNPVSTMVTFALFVAPLLATLSGETGSETPAEKSRETSVETSGPYPRFLRGVLAPDGETEARGKPRLTRFLPARARFALDALSARPIAWQGSGDLAAAAQANCFVVVPEGVDRLAPGHPVALLLI